MIDGLIDAGVLFNQPTDYDIVDSCFADDVEYVQVDPRWVRTVHWKLGTVFVSDLWYICGYMGLFRVRFAV